MRPLLVNREAVPKSSYRTFVRRALVEAGVANNLSGESAYLALNALVLDRAEFAELQGLCSAFAGIFANAADRIVRCQAERARFGLPSDLWALAELEPGGPVMLGRFDCLLDERGVWKIVEYNADTCAGLQETAVVDALAFELMDRPGLVTPCNSEFGERLIDAFRGALPSRRPILLGLEHPSWHIEDRAQMLFLLGMLRRGLAGEHVELVLGGAENLSGGEEGLWLCGRRLDAVFRYHTPDELLTTPPGQALRDALAAGTVRMLNGVRGMIQQHKGLMAWIWEYRTSPLFSPAEQVLIQKHLPATRWARDLPNSFNRRGWLVKHAWGFEGTEVEFAASLSNKAWQRCRALGEYVVQERVHSPPLPNLLWTWRGEPEPCTAWCTVGGYVMHGIWSGCMSRLGDVITRQAHSFLPTFVELSGGTPVRAQAVSF